MSRFHESTPRRSGGDFFYLNIDMIQHGKIHTAWYSYVNEVEQEIRKKYNSISDGEIVKRETKGNITKIWVYTDKPRKDEIQKSLNNKNSLLYSRSTQTLSFGRAASPTREKKLSSVGIIEVSAYASKEKMQIIFKPNSSYFGGPGKLNEKNFIEGMLKAKADIETEKNYIIVRFVDNIESKYEIRIDSHSKISDISTLTGKGDVVVGNKRVSLKMGNAAYVASLNEHPSYVPIGHGILQKMAEEDNISYLKSYIQLKKFPYLNTDIEQKKELLFSSGTTEDAENRETKKTPYRANVVIVNDFSEQTVKLVRSRKPNESHVFVVRVERVITPPNVKSLFETDFDVNIFVRNATVKGQRFSYDIGTKADFLKWLEENPLSIPKGIRLNAVFAKKNKNSDHIKIESINT